MCDLHTKSLLYVCIDIKVPVRNNVPGEKDLNYLGIAFAKIAFTADSLSCSEDKPDYIRVGEVYWIGSVIEASGRFAYAFSGAAEAIDKEIINSALEFHAKL
jgi:hypothetical protein